MFLFLIYREFFPGTVMIVDKNAFLFFRKSVLLKPCCLMKHQGTGIHDSLLAKRACNLRGIMFIDSKKIPFVSYRETPLTIRFPDIFTYIEVLRKSQASFLCQTDKLSVPQLNTVFIWPLPPTSSRSLTFHGAVFP